MSKLNGAEFNSAYFATTVRDHDGDETFKTARSTFKGDRDVQRLDAPGLEGKPRNLKEHAGSFSVRQFPESSEQSHEQEVNVSMRSQEQLL